MKSEVLNINSSMQKGRLHSGVPVVMKSFSSLGIDISRLTATGPDYEDAVSGFRDAYSRSGIIAVVGGLGAAAGDSTRRIISETLGIKTRFQRKAMENIARYFSERGETAPKNLDCQAELPEGSIILDNPKGSSPGFMVETEDGRVILALPPSEAEAEYIFEKHLFEYLRKKFEQRIRKSSLIHMAGRNPAGLMEKLREIINTEQELESGEVDFDFTEKGWGTDIDITCTGTNELLVDELMHKTKQEIISRAGDNIFGMDGETLEGALGKLLVKKRFTLAVAESCTGGLLASKITDAAGSSVYFKLGLVTYSSSAKVKQLGVDKNIIDSAGAVSKETAAAMAQRIKNISGADCCLSVTGYAGPAGGGGKEPGTGYIGMAVGDSEEVFRLKFSGPREAVKKKFAYAAMEYLWRRLKDE